MKISQRIKVLFLCTISMVIPNTIYSVANADVLGHVEDHQIGVVINHAVSPDGKFVYSTTISPTKVYVHSRDPETGKLLAEIQSLEASNFISGKNPSFFPYGIVVSPDSKQVYISAQFGIPGDTSFNYDESVLRFDVSANGDLSYNNRVITDADRGLAMTNDGKFLYVGSNGADARIAAISRASDGNIAAIETIYTDLNSNKFNDTQKITISPDNKNLYASSTSFDGHLYILSINASSGKLTSTKTYIHKNITDPLWKNTDDVAIDGSGGHGAVITNDGKFFYSIGGYGGDDKALSIFEHQSSGDISFIDSVKSPAYPNGTTGYSSSDNIIISPNQKYIYAYVNYFLGDMIDVWARNEQSGHLSFLGRVTDIDNNLAAKEMVLSKDERHLYINTAEGITVFDLRADMSVVKSDGVDPVEPSAIIDYTLAVTNNAPSDAQNVVVVDTLPAGTSFVSGTVNSPTGSCSASGQVVTCTMGQVLAGDGYNAAIKVTAPATEGLITNTVTVSSDQIDTNTTNDTDTETTTVNSSGTTPTNPATPSTGGGGSLPLEFLLLLILPALLRRNKI
jgi:uncharacterized repeat protein (TIGR01451 family)